MFLLGKNNYEPCKSCETVKAQLEIANQEKRELHETLIKLVEPQITYQEKAPVVINPVPVMQRFSQRREALENNLKVAKETRQRSPFIAKPTSTPDDITDKPNNIVPDKITSETIDEMEARLGLNETTKVEANG